MSLLDDVSIVVTPNGYKAGTLYGVLPVPTEGSDLVTNGGFDTDSDWSKGTGWTISGGTANSDGTSGSNNLSQSGILEVGKQYKIDITVSNYVSGNVEVSAGASPRDTMTANGTYTFYQTCTPSTTFYIIANSFDGSVDNVSVKEWTASDMDVTRATAATRVDENGLVNYAEVLSSELVTDGDFLLTGTQAQNVIGTYWTTGAGWTIASGVASCDGTQTSGTQLTQTGLTFTNAITYKVTYTLTVSAGNIDARLQGGGATVTGTSRTSSGTYTDYLVSTGNTSFRMRGNTDFVGTVTNISVKQADRNNVPRIDYTGGGCPHILAEPQRTNLITYSEDFSNASWLKLNSTVNPNTSVSPDGTLNADEFIPDNTTANIFIYNQVTFSASDYTLSFFIKYNGRQYVQLLFGSTATFDFANFDLINHTVTSGNGSIEDYGNDWYKISLTSNLSAVSSEVYLWSIDSATSLRASLSTGNGTDGYYVYGGQLEQGSYLTSYIPTSGSTVTRNQDQFTRDGIGSLINSTEGVLFAEMAALDNDLTTRMISLSDGTNTNRIHMFYHSVSNEIAVNYRVSGTTEASIGFVVSNITNFNKIAFKWKSADFSLWINGVEVGTDSNTTMLPADTLNELAFEQGDGGNNLYAKVKQLQVYKTALGGSPYDATLSDERLAALTSL